MEKKLRKQLKLANVTEKSVVSLTLTTEQLVTTPIPNQNRTKSPDLADNLSTSTASLPVVITELTTVANSSSASMNTSSEPQTTKPQSISVI